MARTGSHAVVIGASMGGLLTARALLGPYHTVTVLDRDELPTDGRGRKGVPQGRHAHALLPRGGQILGAMFPRLLGELEAAGVPVSRDWEQVVFSFGGHPLAGAGPAPAPAYQASRPFLESRVRTHLGALPGVQVVHGTEVTGLLAAPAGARVTGVRIRRDGHDGELTADLVVDASGRSGRAPVWLRGLGCPSAPEESMPVDLVYASRELRLLPGALGPVQLVLIGPRPGMPCGFALFAVEGGRWILTLAGYTGHHPPTDEAGFDAFTETVMPAHILAAVLDAQSLSEVVAHRFPSGLRRRYEKLERFPAGFLVAGDAFCSFNPLYGQGMTVAALQAQALRRCLSERADDKNLARRFFQAAAKPVDVAWQLAVGADLALPEVPGHRSPRTRALNAYVDRVQTAAERDPAVADTFMRVTGLLAPPTRLLAPGIASRAARVSRASRRNGTVPAAIPAARPPSARTTITHAGMVFEVSESGPSDGEPVLLLHGFPQHADSWDALVPLLTAQGYRTLAPNQRGYSPQARPPGRGAYRTADLLSDTLALIDARGGGPVHVVGHDWGAAIAWALAAHHPDKVATLTAVSVPHPNAFLEAAVTSRQALHSWYMLAFQVPWLPERLLHRHLVRFLRDYAGQSPEHAHRDAVALPTPSDLTGPPNWYRAIPLANPWSAVPTPVTSPTLFIWSDRDVAITHRAAANCRDHVDAPFTFETLDGVSHWIPDEAPHQLAALLLPHMQKYPAEPRRAPDSPSHSVHVRRSGTALTT